MKKSMTFCANADHGSRSGYPTNINFTRGRGWQRKDGRGGAVVMLLPVVILGDGITSGGPRTDHHSQKGEMLENHCCIVASRDWDQITVKGLTLCSFTVLVHPVDAT